MLSGAGDQLPVMPFCEVVGNALKASPEQIAPIAAKAGVVDEFTVIVRVVGAAHCPAVGVKV